MNNEIRELLDKLDTANSNMALLRQKRDMVSFSAAYIEREIISFRLLIAEAKEREAEPEPEHLRALAYLEKAKEAELPYHKVREALETGELKIDDWEVPPLSEFMSEHQKLIAWKKKEHMISVSKKWAEKNLDKVVEKDGNYYLKAK
jgi:hypothetical protein